MPLPMTMRGSLIAFPQSLRNARRCARAAPYSLVEKGGGSLAIVSDGDVAQAISSCVPPGPGGLSPYISVGWSYVTGTRMRRLHIVCAPRLSFVQGSRRPL